ncbi:MAG: hypothetical protein ACYTGV_12850, partial [Planctomycetota bacterium]
MIEPLPVIVDGKRLIALRDPEEYAPESALVEPGALSLLAMFDGTNTLDDIRVQLARTGAGFVGLEV